jgi:hypothetical protein
MFEQGKDSAIVMGITCLVFPRHHHSQVLTNHVNLLQDYFAFTSTHDAGSQPSRRCIREASLAGAVEGSGHVVTLRESVTIVLFA